MMLDKLDQADFQRLWKRLQQLGLNAYEARAYLVLVGHPRFKALELAARAHVPRQKVYEVLDGLVEKGFAQVVQEKTKLFSAVDPGLAVTGFLSRRHLAVKEDLHEQSRLGHTLVEELNSVYSEGQEGRGTLDYLQIISEPAQSGYHYRTMISQARNEYLEFSRPPYAVDPLEEDLIFQARQRGVACRLLIEAGPIDDGRKRTLLAYQEAGVAIRQVAALPMKLALFDGEHGLIALLDPVISKPAWTSVVFNHSGMGEAMKGLFEAHWSRAQELDGGMQRSLSATS